MESPRAFVPNGSFSSFPGVHPGQVSDAQGERGRAMLRERGRERESLDGRKQRVGRATAKAEEQE